MVARLWSVSSSPPNGDQVPNVTPYIGSKVIVVGNGNTLPISSVRLGKLHVNDNCDLTVNSLIHTP